VQNPFLTTLLPKSAFVYGLAKTYYGISFNDLATEFLPTLRIPSVAVNFFES
jgi:hypothetical protein